MKSTLIHFVQIVSLLFTLNFHTTFACFCSLPNNFTQTFCKSAFAALVQVQSNPVHAQSNPFHWLDSTISTQSRPTPLHREGPSSAKIGRVSPARVIALNHFSQLPNQERLSNKQVQRLMRTPRSANFQQVHSYSLSDQNEFDPPAEKFAIEDEVMLHDRSEPLKSVQSNPIPVASNQAKQKTPTASAHNGKEKEDDYVTTYYSVKVLNEFHAQPSQANQMNLDRNNVRLYTQIDQPTYPISSCHLTLRPGHKYIVWATLDDTQTRWQVSFCTAVQIDWINSMHLPELQQLIEKGLKCSS